MYVCRVDIELLGAGALLRKYINIVCSHVADVLPKAASFAEGGSRQFVLAAHIISKDITGFPFSLHRLLNLRSF